MPISLPEPHALQGGVTSFGFASIKAKRVRSICPCAHAFQIEPHPCTHTYREMRGVKHQFSFLVYYTC